MPEALTTYMDACLRSLLSHFLASQRHTFGNVNLQNYNPVWLGDQAEIVVRLFGVPLSNLGGVCCGDVWPIGHRRGRTFLVGEKWKDRDAHLGLWCCDF